MLSRTRRIIVASVATALFMIFILGLAHSISTGFAGFWGGLPFWIIAIAVICMALYDWWRDAVQGKR